MTNTGNTAENNTAENINKKIDGSKLSITFCGGVGSVTGANFLLTGPLSDKSGTARILVDCGIEQGTHDAIQNNHKKFIYNPAEAQVLLITHAHMDHIGRVPKLVKDGFDGVIYSTPETKALAELMLADALKLVTQEAERNKITPLYGPENVSKTLGLWKSIPYHEHREILPGYSVYLKDSGHVLGSCMYEVSCKNVDAKNGDTATKKPIKIVFTGDLGNSPTPLLRDTEEITDADYVLMESVYGDRNHEDRATRLSRLEKVLKDNHDRGGVLMMPIFSLEKTQELLFEIHKLMDEKRIPITPVYMDSPLAIKITEIYKKLHKDFNPEAEKELMGKHHDIFSFPGLHITETSEESKAIAHSPSPKIIMAGSGMSNGGRIQHHEMHYLTDPKNTIVFIGYQAVGTLGRAIEEGAKEVEIVGVKIKVNARVEAIEGYSSHRDSDHLVEFVSHTAPTVKGVFVVMGDTKASLFLAQRLRDYLGVKASHPEEGATVYLD